LEIQYKEYDFFTILKDKCNLEMLTPVKATKEMSDVLK
jgi:hypothetical protein